MKSSVATGTLYISIALAIIGVAAVIGSVMIHRIELSMPNPIAITIPTPIPISILPWYAGTKDAPLPYICFAAMKGENNLLALSCLNTPK